MVRTTVITDFDIQQQLGKGAFGIVYKAVHKHTGKDFALKSM